MEPKFLSFNSFERKGLFILVIIIAFLWTLPWLLRKPAIKISEAELLAFPGKIRTSSIKHDAEEASAFFSFDPNSATKDQLVQLGIKEKTAGNIIRFREKGGKFRTKEDLEKIWGIDSRILDSLKVYARFPKSVSSPVYSERKLQEPKRKTEINSADSAALESLPGIGPKLASRIINYREKLGGFINLDQLREIYGLKDSLLEKALPMLTISPGKVRSIDLNQATEADLRSHPYFRQVARVIIAYRNQHGPYSSLDELRHIMIINDSIMGRIVPYARVE